MDKCIITLISILGLFYASGCTKTTSERAGDGIDSVINISNGDIKLSIKKRGGAFVNFHLLKNPLNPFGWKLLPEQMPENNQPYTFDGHFLCTGRWGAPSDGEIKAGIPHNGEVNTQIWEEVILPNKQPGFQVTKMICKAPIEKLNVDREIFVPDEGSYFIVRERFTNGLPIGRLSNVVQHGTIAAPFLSESTIINTNATLGFDQRTNYQFLEDSSFTWPTGKMADGSEVDLRRVTSQDGYVTTHIFEDSIGWITALNPDKNILMGYVWKTVEYPWLNVWHMSKGGKPFVQGLEFGTAGLGKPYRLLVENNVTFFGRNSFEYIDAGETMEKSWVCFMIEMPDNFEEVRSLVFKSGEIVIKGETETLKIAGDFQFLWK